VYALGERITDIHHILHCPFVSGHHRSLATVRNKKRLTLDGSRVSICLVFLANLRKEADMTLERIGPQDYRLLGTCEYVDLYDIGEVPSLYSPVTPEIQPPDWPVEKPEAVSPQPRRRALDHLLGRFGGHPMILCYSA
jgi:hypothetical protein